MLLAVSLMLALQAVSGMPDNLVLPAPYKAMRQGSHNPDPKSNADERRLNPSTTLTLLDAAGPGMVTHLWMTLADSEYGWPRLLRLRVYYDDSTAPSVDVPLGDFFAAGHGREKDVNSLPVRNTSQGRAKNCYWQMPYLKHVKITLTNEGKRPSALTYWQVDYRAYKSLPKDILYFHALYRQELPAVSGRNYAILDTRGRGQYVGTVINVITNEDNWFGEGDDYFYVDGEKEASLAGTGTEDFFSDAWGLHDQQGLYTGTTAAGGFQMGDRVSAYRWQLRDPVPFTKSLHVEIEHSGWTNKPNGDVHSGFEERPDDFSSVAFWYQTPFRTDLPPLPYGPARLPYGNATVIDTENLFPQVKAENGHVEVQKGVFWEQNILFFNQAEKGSTLTVPFEVTEADHYEVMPTMISSYDYGMYTAELDGKPVGGTMNLYASDVLMPQGYPLGRFDLIKGTHVLKFKCVGKSDSSAGYFLGVHQIVLSKTSKAYPPIRN
ncbi:MAG: DUF2961 domain-containing protein [Fimbriimonas sp.]|nr:DUF2961 domain-containing protein [Fimbriimonas sp.]